MRHVAAGLARPLLFLAFLGFSTIAVAQETPWHQMDFPAEEFQARWAKVFDKIGNQAVAVLQGMPQTNGFLMPRQTNEFYYLSGIETPGSTAPTRLRTRCRKSSMPV